MGKTGKKGLIIVAILLAVFSVIAFVPPFTINGAFFVAYAFGVIAILLQIYIFKVSFANGKGAKSKFYGFPIAKVGIIYLVAQLVISIAEFCMSSILKTWLAVLVNAVFFAVVAVGLITVESVRDEIERQDNKLKQDVENMRALQSLTASLVNLATDNDIKKSLEDLADEFKYSDPISKDETKEQESELKFLVNEIQRALVDEDIDSVKKLVVRTKNGLAERNRICKLAK